MNRLAAEAFGTFCLVFAGTGAMVVQAARPAGDGQLCVALSFGLVVLAMIYAVGDVSGCHINPAVTAGFWLAGRFPGARIAPYVAAQCAGALAASAALRALFPASPTLGETAPAATAAQAWAMEFLLTLILMFVVLRVSTGPKEVGVLAGVAVGAVVALEAMFAGPVSGASMNPARSLAPALVAGKTEHLWIYLTAPVAGAAAGVAACTAVRGPRGEGADE